MLKISVLFVCLCSLSLAVDLCALRLAFTATDYQKLATYRDELHRSIADKELDPHPLLEKDFQSVEKTGKSHLGLINQGILRATTQGKSYILKARAFYTPIVPNSYQVANQLHNLLGQMDLAPKVIGVLGPNEMAKIAAKYPVISYPRPLTGLVMEEIPDAWNPKNTIQGQAPAPKWVKQLDQKEIKLRLEQLERVLLALGINPEDLQVFITKDNRVVLGDLDLYSVSPDPESSFYKGNVEFFFEELWSDIRTHIRQ